VGLDDDPGLRRPSTAATAHVVRHRRRRVVHVVGVRDPDGRCRHGPRLAVPACPWRASHLRRRPFRPPPARGGTVFFERADQHSAASRSVALGAMPSTWTLVLLMALTLFGFYAS